MKNRTKIFLSGFVFIALLAAVLFVPKGSKLPPYKSVGAQSVSCPAGQAVTGAQINMGASCSAFVSTSAILPDWTLQPGLFSTAALTGQVYYVANGAALQRVITRVGGAANICITAPTIVVMDLGTSATTTYGSATVLYSQTVTAGAGVFDSGAITGISLPSGHFLGYAVSAGSCVTPPTLSTTATLL